MPVQSYQPQINLTVYETAAKQRRLLRSLLALAVLAVFALVLVKYSGWFQSLLPGASNEARVSTPDATAGKLGPGAPATRRSRSKSRADAVVPSGSEARLTSDVAESTFRQPLLVEVIYGTGQRQWIRTRDDSIYLDLRDNARSTVVDANAYEAGVTQAADRVVELTPPAAAPGNPLFAKQQMMEGSVVLLARIDKDGNIQKLQAVSGPESLYGAAREAVKQWRFKPYYKSGKAVETDAQITVKFAIAAH